MIKGHEITLEDNKVLLEETIDSQKKVAARYQPGPYWVNKSKVAQHVCSFVVVGKFWGYD